MGGHAKYDVPLNLYSLALRSQTVLGVHHGSRRQLQELVQLVASEQVSRQRSVVLITLNVFTTSIEVNE